MIKQAAVVITSINSPTKAVEKYAEISSLQTIVIGDTKTPKDWRLDGAIYLSVEEQIKKYSEFGEGLPVRHYCRKNIGYLEAMRLGYKIIVDTDDDNLPLDNWRIPERKGSFLCSPRDQDFINVYSYFSDSFIWPRGLPLECVKSKQSQTFKTNLKERALHVPVWQGLANGDPDVDAVYRLIINKPCTFDNRAPIVLDKGTVSPYNSQNTISYEEAFTLLYLPSSVSFRFTDILRGLIGQVILWDHGCRLGFFEATVFQDRNIHNYFDDFKDEIPVFLNSRNVIDIAQGAIVSGQSMQEQLREIYRALVKEEIVGPTEIKLVDLWLKELRKFNH
jgi:hypothetical protein